MSDVVEAPRIYTGRLAEMGERLARVEEKLDAALLMRPDITALVARVVALEIDLASAKAKTDIWRRIVDMAWALGLTVIGAGVWFGPNVIN
jgi:hypothetical protein